MPPLGDEKGSLQHGRPKWPKNMTLNLNQWASRTSRASNNTLGKEHGYLRETRVSQTRPCFVNRIAQVRKNEQMYNIWLVFGSDFVCFLAFSGCIWRSKVKNRPVVFIDKLYFENRTWNSYICFPHRLVLWVYQSLYYSYQRWMGQCMQWRNRLEMFGGRLKKVTINLSYQKFVRDISCSVFITPEVLFYF